MPKEFFTPSRTPASPQLIGATSPESSDDGSAEDPFSAGSDGTAGSTEDEGTRQNTLTNSRNIPSALQVPSSMPGNPFKKTLSGLGTKEEHRLHSHSSEQRSENGEPNMKRPLYDVDDFKRLLLTGKESTPPPPVASPPPVTFHRQLSVGDSSSNTDASSISRQSILEPTAGFPHESPRTSYEGSPIEDERQQPTGDPSPRLQKSKPSTPEHRHGKLVNTNGPQTVSFEDPSLSFSSPTISTKSSIGRPTPTSPRTSSDTDKPLPLLPSKPGSIAEPVTAAGYAAISIPKRETYSESANVPKRQMSQKRDPPTPPLSRRHSQLKPKPLANSERSTPISKPDFSGVARPPPSTASTVPPPPPPRRAGGLSRVNSSSSVSTTESVAPTQSQSSTDEVLLTPLKPRPPVPPNHSPSISSVKRQSTQPFSGSPAMAPPPPPRRRGSSQSSYTPSRLSEDHRTAVTERLRSDSGASSISHLQMTPMTLTPSSTESKDVMADLTALQKEVDELRGKFRD